MKTEVFPDEEGRVKAEGREFWVLFRQHRS